jgi:hypothetical protein
MKTLLCFIAALGLSVAPALATPVTTQPNAVGMIVSPCSNNVPLVGTGSGNPEGCWGTGALGTVAGLNLGISVANPGTGNAEFLLPVKTNTASGSSCTTSCTYNSSDLFQKTRRSNSGTAMTDTFPASSTTGLANGTRIDIANVDASANDTITAGSGTTINGNATYVIPAGRDIWFVYDLANTMWRIDANTGSALLMPTPTRAGDIVYWNGTAWVSVAGNNTGTQFLQETASGVPSWNTVSGSGTVTSATIAGGNGIGVTGTCTITSTGTCTVALSPPDSSTWNASGIANLVALGIGEAVPSAGNINISGNYQVAGTQIAASNLGNGTTGTGAIVLKTSPTLLGTVTEPDSSTWTSSGIGSLVALGVGEVVPTGGNVNISGGYQIAGASVLSSTTLGSGITASSLTSVGANLTVGTASGANILNINGAASGAGSGPYLNFEAGGVQTGAIGGYSAIIGGAYHAGVTIYSAVAINLVATSPSTASCSSGLQTSSTGQLSCISSTQRYKNSIEDLPDADALATVLRLQPVTYRFNDDAPVADAGEEAVGLTAEQSYSVDTRLAGVDKDGRPLTVRTDRIVGELVGAIRALRTELDSVKRQIR